MGPHNSVRSRFRSRQSNSGAFVTMLGLTAFSAPVPLQISAIAALGMVADPADRPLLERFVDDPDYRFRTAAAAALKKGGE
jgi:HEAT repeat protein